MSPEANYSPDKPSLTEMIHMARIRQTALGAILGTDEHGAGAFRLKLDGGHEWGPPLSTAEVDSLCELYDCEGPAELYDRAETFFENPDNRLSTS
jgi:hypothetical protein